METQQFSKDKRLLTPADFKKVMDAAELKVHHPYFMLLAIRSSKTLDRIGFIIAKKKIKLAVGRNRIKRCVRDTFRRQVQSNIALDIVFLAKPGLGLIDSQKLHADFVRGMQQLQLKANKQPHIPS